MKRRRRWHRTRVLLPGKSHGQRSLVGCSPWGRWGLDTTERLHFHFSLSCIGEGNGNPLQCSCLENPRDGGAWWEAVYGVPQSRTRLSDFTFTSLYSLIHWRLVIHISCFRLGITHIQEEKIVHISRFQAACEKCSLLRIGSLFLDFVRVQN